LAVIGHVVGMGVPHFMINDDSNLPCNHLLLRVSPPKIENLAV
jgi:hypothetical protein